ncbi:MAG TPA: universal stress protein [Terriglobales bacterium]|jgi:nucleotide-binding universal stress UspA family protein|nr:universal stress protein [Terriglobales bacterium]
MYHRILVPLDGSELSAGVLPYVRWLVRALNTPVELLYVIDPAHPTLTPGTGYLNSLAASFSALATVKCKIDSGYPADIIVDVAAAEPATLVAMATHGYSGAKRWLLGSVAEKVLHSLAGDLFLVRPGAGESSAEVQLKTALVPLDGSKQAERIFPTVLEMAQRLDLGIQLLHVTRRVYAAPPDAFVPVFGATPNFKELWAQDRAAANQYLTEKAAQLRAQGAAKTSAAVIEAGADGRAGEIIDHADNVAASLIAMTSHGRSGIGRWLIGSVTERVARHSKRPVFIVRPRA